MSDNAALFDALREACGDRWEGVCVDCYMWDVRGDGPGEVMASERKCYGRAEHDRRGSSVPAVEVGENS